MFCRQREALAGFLRKKVIRKRCLGKIHSVVHHCHNCRCCYYPSFVHSALCLSAGAVRSRGRLLLVPKRCFAGGFTITPISHDPALHFRALGMA